MSNDLRMTLSKVEEITYLEDVANFMNLYKISRELVEDVVRFPERIDIDPKTKEVGYLILSLQRGELSLAVSFKKGYTAPTVMYVHLSSSGYRSVRSKTPKTPAEMQRYFVQNGCKVQLGAGELVVTYHNKLIGIINLSTYEQTSPDEFKSMVRRMREVQSEIAQATALENEQ